MEKYINIYQTSCPWPDHWEILLGIHCTPQDPGGSRGRDSAGSRTCSRDMAGAHHFPPALPSPAAPFLQVRLSPPAGGGARAELPPAEGWRGGTSVGTLLSAANVLLPPSSKARPCKFSYLSLRQNVPLSICGPSPSLSFTSQPHALKDFWSRLRSHSPGLSQTQFLHPGSILFSSSSLKE